MQITNFFKTLNKKIKDYDKVAQNPFLNNRQLILIWIEDCNLNPTDNFGILYQDDND